MKSYALLSAIVAAILVYPTLPNDDTLAMKRKKHVKIAALTTEKRKKVHLLEDPNL